jgi:RNAse (barnase) inhibitor barstar
MTGRIDALKFVHDINAYRPDGAFVVRLPAGLKSRDHLLTLLYELLMLPDYFGFNWDALYDCLRDFNWLDTKLIVISHEDLPSLDKKDLKVYLEILADSCLDWKPDEEHKLEVVFPESLRAEIMSLLRTGSP